MRRLLWLALAACTPERPQGDCLFWSDCGEGGACEYTAAVEGKIRFECSFADAGCETGRRFGEFASSERANQCVEFASGVGGICDEAHDCAEGTDCRLGRCINVKDLDATQNAFAALCSDHLRDGGDVYLWGFALDVLPSQIGIGVTFDAAPLTAAHMTMPGFPVIDTTSMTMGDNHFCSIGTTTAGDYSFCFGRDGGAMGPDPAVGVDPDGVGSVFGKDNPFGLHTLLSAGITHTCGLRAGTTQLVDCWGENGDRQLDGTASDVAESTVSLGNRVGDVTTGPNFTCAGTAAGVTCWGNGTWAPGTFLVDDGSPQAVQGLPDGAAAIVAAGRAHACAILDGQLWCWGANDGGQVTGEISVVRQLPMQPLGTTPVINVAAGRVHTCAITAEHQVMCWGENGVGQLGSDTTEHAPQVVPLEARAVGPIALADDATCVVLEDSLVHCFGSPDLTTNYTPPLDRFGLCLE